MRIKLFTLALVLSAASAASAQDPNADGKPVLILGGNDYSHLLPAEDEGEAAASDVFQTSATVANVYDARMAELEAKYASLEAQFRNTQNNKSRSCCIQRCCTCPGIVAGAELAVLKPHLGNIAGVIGPDFSHVASPRIWLGYVNANGFGGRIRYWGFDREDDTGTSSIETHTVDFEFTQSAQLGRWDVLGAAGVRLSTFEFATTAPIPVVLDFDGTGPTLALEANRRLADSNLSLVANARTALLFGQTTVDILGGDIGDHDMFVAEMGVGLQYDRVREGGTFFARLMYEAQRWESGELFGLFGPDYSFVGPSIALGLTR